MLYDLYARENLKSRPEWAQEILYRPFCEDFYRDETLTRQYLPSYSGCTSRQMKRMTHMEGFVMDGTENFFMSNEEVLAVGRILLESGAFSKKEINTILDKLIAGCVPCKNKRNITKLLANERYRYVE